MKPETVRHLGQTLYGSMWQKDLAAALGVSQQTINAWINGRREPKPDRREAARQVVLAKIEALRQTLKGL